MDLPPCPEDLNEPQYANLFFEKFCHVRVTPIAVDIIVTYA